MAKQVTSKASSLLQTLRSYIKKPWEITGPCSHPEYRDAVPGALEYRLECPASTKLQPIIPAADPNNVFDIKYFSRDQRRNRPPIRRTVYKKADVEQIMKEKTFNVAEFPKVYLTTTVEEDYSARGGGYE